MLTVIRHRLIPAPPGDVWRFLTEPALLAEWFADAGELGPSKSFRFDFGDGDFFTGFMNRWHRPTFLEMTWKFMDVGPVYHVEYALTPNGPDTFITVRDRGALTEDEASGLSDGWDDFLTRLEVRVRTGELTRYRWSDNIAAGAVVPATSAASVYATLRRTQWWQTAFPECGIVLENESPAAEILARFGDRAWSGRETKASVRIAAQGDDVHVAIFHTGWQDLPEQAQLGERRRYAQRWAEVLHRLETHDAHVGAARA
jgi:uncharacterized protein YndB with AHSA1/START domain